MARLLFFGKLADTAAGREKDWLLDAETMTVATLIKAIGEKDARLGEVLSAPSVRYAVNEAIVDRDAPIADGDEIAFLPPVSGG